MELLIALTDYQICSVAKNTFLQYTKWGTGGGTGTIVFSWSQKWKENSLDKQAILWSVCLLLANTHIYNTQYLLSICIYTHRLVLKHQRRHCFLSLVHTNREDTIEDVKRLCSLSSVWTELLMSIQGYGKVLDLQWSFPAFLIITNSSHSPPEHSPYPVCGIFLEKLCHSWQLSMAQTWRDLSGPGRSQGWMWRICIHSPNEFGYILTLTNVFLILLQVWPSGVC